MDWSTWVERQVKWLHGRIDVDAWMPFRFIETSLPRAGREDEVTLDVPAYRQLQSYTCGYVSGLVALRFLRPRASERRFLRLCDPDSYGLVSQNRLERALRACGVRLSVRPRLSFADIRRAIDAQRPVLTTVRDGWHWVVVYGYGTSPRRVFVANDRRNRLGWRAFVRSQGSEPGGIVCSLR